MNNMILKYFGFILDLNRTCYRTALILKSQVGRGLWTVYYAIPQSFIVAFSIPLA